LRAIPKIRMRLKSSNVNQYMIGSDATGEILGEKEHITTVSIQRELFAKLKEERAGMTPEEFLEVYEQMPYSLIEARETELQQANVGKPGLEERVETPISRMVNVADLILQN